jgi:hypothetical protein
LLENNDNILGFLFRIIILVNNQYLAEAKCGEGYGVVRNIFIFVVKEAVRVDFSDNVLNIEQTGEFFVFGEQFDDIFEV